MKVYKKDLNEFIEAVEKKAIKSITETFNGIVGETKNQRFELVEEDIKEIERLLILAHAKAEKVRAVQEYWSEGYYCEIKIRDAISHAKCISVKGMIETDEEKRTLQKMNQTIYETETEYRKVKSYIKSNTPKKGYNYLKEIGFDVTSIPVYDDKASRTTEIATIVDCNKLFVCGDNK